MKKLPPLCALILLSCLTASARQSGPGYRFDNFDVPGGVRVELPPQPAARKGKLKLTARIVPPLKPAASQPAPQHDNLRSTAPATTALSTSLQMAVGSALDGFSTGAASAAVSILLILFS